ncbi:hypothetical protein DCAR_0933441 [Daucus carota subsp. sativus]|uniref:DUF659 domain-containing protein n=1 Tax=Daucus carota subsp. sativus TaxID=79200 RepID=A0AAF1BDF5_DAUCS|nr:hypothetical protein DCAR_0933441 [Daucus carota subsp. sativus]
MIECLELNKCNFIALLFKRRTNEVHTYLAHWVYGSGVSFNSINNDSFRRLVEAVGQFGPRYKPATQKQEDEWNDGCCSVMTDAWSDRKKRIIMNLCLNYKIGTKAHPGKYEKYICDYVDKWIDNTRRKNVIQVVTDNATNNFVAARFLKQKRPRIFWSACAAHTLNLVLEAIGMFNLNKCVIDKANSLTIYIYAHHKTLALMRKFTKKRDIVRSGVTRSASSFLTLESMLEKQESLKYIFMSGEWSGCRWATQPKGMEAYNTIVSQFFWTNLSFCVEIFKPLVKLLRLVAGNLRSSMGFIYSELKNTKKQVIRICKEVKEIYIPIMYIIDSKIKD